MLGYFRMLKFYKLPKRWLCSQTLLNINTKQLPSNKCLSKLNNYYTQICVFSVLQTNNCNTGSKFTTSTIIRLKYEDSRKKRQKNFKRSDDYEDSDDEENDNDYDDNESEELKLKGVDIKKLLIPSLRIDLLLKKALKQSRRSIEEYVYQNKLKINGKSLIKKGANIKVGDTIDLIKGVSPQSSDYLMVDRVEILTIEVDDAENNFIVKVKSSKNLRIEN